MASVMTLESLKGTEPISLLASGVTAFPPAETTAIKVNAQAEAAIAITNLMGPTGSPPWVTTAFAAMTGWLRTTAEARLGRTGAGAIRKALAWAKQHNAQTSRCAEPRMTKYEGCRWAKLGCGWPNHRSTRIQL